MAGDIWFGYDKSDPKAWKKNDGYFNSQTFSAFGALLDAALSEKHLAVLEKIKESEAMSMYNFGPLSAEDYNAAILAIRTHIAKLTEPTKSQERALWVWREEAEPFIRKDDRYDFVLHGEQPPAP
jgi:hypothetical protein